MGPYSVISFLRLLIATPPPPVLVDVLLYHGYTPPVNTQIHIDENKYLKTNTTHKLYALSIPKSIYLSLDIDMDETSVEAHN